MPTNPPVQAPTNNVPEVPTPPVYQPLVDRQKWNTEYGFTDAYKDPAPSLGENLLGNALVGFGAGAGAGALAGRNHWVSGLNTAGGTTLGYLLANALSRNSPNQELYSSLGAIGGGLGGIGLSLTAPKREDKKNFEVKLPGNLQLSAKTASVLQTLRNIQGQLPNIRLPDTLAGAGLGAGVGYLYDKYNPDEQNPKKKRLNRILAGAGIGAAGSNVLGDRFRRYVTNTVEPFGYSNKGNSTTAALKPGSFKRFWDASVMDRPQQDGVKKYLGGDYKGWRGKGTDVTAARRELQRLAMGVQTYNPKENIWLKQPDNTYSINPNFGDSESMIQHMMYPPKNDRLLSHKFLQDPMSVIGAINTGKTLNDSPGYMQDITGGQRIAVTPSQTGPESSLGKPGYNNYIAKIQDRWNTELRGYERQSLTNWAKQRYLHGDRNAKIEDYYTSGRPEDTAKSYVERWVNQHLLYKNAPWVSQRLYLQKQPMLEDRPDVDTGYASIPTTASGQMYHGNVIGSYNPTTHLMDLKNDSIVPDLASGNYMPPIPPEQAPAPRIPSS